MFSRGPAGRDRLFTDPSKCGTAARLACSRPAAAEGGRVGKLAAILAGAGLATWKAVAHILSRLLDWMVNNDLRRRRAVAETRQIETTTQRMQIDNMNRFFEVLEQHGSQFDPAFVSRVLAAHDQPV